MIRMTCRHLMAGCLAASFLVMALSPLFAEDAPDQQTTARKRWNARGRLVNVDPDGSSGAVTGIAGSGVRVDDDTGFDLDITHMMDDHWGLELAVAWARLDIRGTGTIAGLGRIADARATPLSLLGQYHFQPDQKTRPYLGLGVALVNFSSERGSAVLNTALGGTTTLSLSDQAGVAFQGGCDFEFSDDWFFNLDAKYSLIDTRATVTTGAVVRAVTIELDPWVLGGGVGARF